MAAGTEESHESLLTSGDTPLAINRSRPEPDAGSEDVNRVTAAKGADRRSRGRQWENQWAMIRIMGLDPDQPAYTKILGALCAFILCVLLTAGLWPFCAPKNDVEWIKAANGLRFGRNGIAASADDFRSISSDNECSLEIWLEPGRMDNSGTILAFDSSPDPNAPFALIQFGAGLAVQRARVDSNGNKVRSWFTTRHVFESGKQVFLTITGGQGKTAVYVNGVLVRAASGFGLVSGDLTGRLLLANSPTRNGWQGEISGLAVYSSALTPAEVKTHFERWMQGESPIVPGAESPVALYRFDEGVGTVVHDRMGSTHNLVIPARYFVLHPPFLESPLGDFHGLSAGWRSWGLLSDVCVNIAGFVPLGFFFTAYLSVARPIRRPRLTVIAMGLAVSLLIEITQYFLPTRNSGINDLITNTLGTAIGVALYSPVSLRKAMSLLPAISSGPAPS